MDDLLPFLFCHNYLAPKSVTFSYFSFILFDLSFLLTQVYITCKIHLFKVHTSVVFSIFMELCTHHHYVIPEYFHHTKQKSRTREQLLLSPLFIPGPWQLLSVSLDLPLLDISHRWNHTICSLLCVAPFI